MSESALNAGESERQLRQRKIYLQHRIPEARGELAAFREERRKYAAEKTELSIDAAKAEGGRRFYVSSRIAELAAEVKALDVERVTLNDRIKAARAA